MRVPAAAIVEAIKAGYPDKKDQLFWLRHERSEWHIYGARAKPDLVELDAAIMEL